MILTPNGIKLLELRAKARRLVYDTTSLAWRSHALQRIFCVQTGRSTDLQPSNWRTALNANV